MYTLTIDDHGAEISTLHETSAAAHAALHTYLVLSDYYHQPTQVNPTYSACKLLTLSGPVPRVVGHAAIKPYSALDANGDRSALFAAASRAIAD